GLIAILITSTTAASLFARGLSVSNAADMALQFTPLFGEFSRFLLGFGLFAAGLSSAITAPLATAFAISEIFAWQEKSGQKSQQTSAQFKAVALSILLIGSIVAITGIKPITLIVTAQFANGLLLPITAGFLLYVVNQHRLLGKHTNGMVANTLGGLVVMITTLLGIRAVLSATGVL
nr:divalent metal cation transporter [Acidiferrobacterales bacterium]